MAISVNWATKVISIPKADLTLVSGTIYEYDLNAFREELKSLEDDEVGVPFLDTHSHVPPVTVGGVTIARVFEIINGYTVTVEDGQYGVNFYGANSNIGDVINRNQVSISTANSAGLADPDIAAAVLDETVEDHNTDGTVGSYLRKILWRSR